MRKKSALRKSHSNAFGIALFVGALVGLLIVSAIVIRILLLFHQSTYDGKHQYILAVTEPDKTDIIAFNPDTSSIHSLIIQGNINKKDLHTLLVPFDGTAITTGDIEFSDLTTKLLFHGKDLHTAMTPIDSFNLFLFSHTTDTSNITSQTISASDILNQKANIAKLFLNETLYKEGKSIAIVNATNVSGLGTTIATLLTNIGGNVVSITTADKPSKTSSIAYTGDMSYTANRLSQLFHMPLVHLPGVTISDITITIGENSVSLFN